MKDKITSADLFEEALYESCDGVSYKYAAYNPVQASDTLVVWLHGLGEEEQLILILILLY